MELLHTASRPARRQLPGQTPGQALQIYTANRRSFASVYLAVDAVEGADFFGIQVYADRNAAAPARYHGIDVMVSFPLSTVALPSALHAGLIQVHSLDSEKLPDMRNHNTSPAKICRGACIP